VIATATNLHDIANKEVLEDVGFFFNKVNQRALYKLGHADGYDDEGEPALGEDVEYFHPQITLDDRMRHIMENIVLSGMDQHNVICNTIISHFYGARGIHQLITRDPNPATALVDFHRLTEDPEYEQQIRDNLERAVALKLPVYGSTELRTSLYGAANSYVAELKDAPRNADKINILLWVASFIKTGVTQQMLEAQSLEQMYKILTKLPGVGQYYGYHCSTSNSVNPAISVNHDERFCVPGPGARKTLDLIFGEDCKVPYGDRVIWFRENYKDYIGDIYLHPSTHNVEVNGTMIFAEQQDDLKVYGSEVGLCQYSVFHRLRANPHLAKRRKVARVSEEQEAQFFEPVG
jgi:hypothetical protein